MARPASAPRFPDMVPITIRLAVSRGRERSSRGKTARRADYEETLSGRKGQTDGPPSFRGQPCRRGGIGLGGKGSAESKSTAHAPRVTRASRQRAGDTTETLGELDCIESADLFAIFKPGSGVDRDSLGDDQLRPLLRQALVAACAAIETFVGDRVMERLRETLDRDDRPTRLLALPMTVGDWLRIDETYERRRWGLREVVEIEVRRMASPAPSQIGIVFGVIGERELWKRVDKARGTSRGRSEEQLSRIYERRNRIAHQGDRSGRGRASITVAEVEADLRCIGEIVSCLDAQTSP